MKEFDFTLKFSVAGEGVESDIYLEALGEEGCTDALVGVGQKGRLAFHFTRAAENANKAILSAICDVEKAIPHARLVEAAPDFVGLSDIAQILGFSRQYIRKLMLNNLSSFPVPIYEGKTTLWHLSKILIWLKYEGKYRTDESLLDIANINMQLNFAKELAGLPPEIHASILSFQSENLVSF